MNNEQAAFAYKIIRQWCRRFGVWGDTGEDVIQESVLLVLKRYNEERGAPFEAFVVMTAKYILVDAIRTCLGRKRSPPVPVGDLMKVGTRDNSFENVDVTEDMKVVEMQLTKRERKYVRLCRHRKKKDVAVLLGVSDAYVSKVYNRARQKVVELMKRSA